MNEKVTYKISRRLFGFLLISCLIGGQATAEVASIDVNSTSQTASVYKGNYQSLSDDVGASSCAAYFKNSVRMLDCREGEVPFPAAAWLFLLALVAFVGLSNKRKV